MSIIVEISNTTIPDSDVKKLPRNDQKITFGAGSNLIASTLEVVLDNTNSDYDDLTAGSLFYGTSWYNDDITIFDDEQNIYLWKGRIKNIKVSDKDKTVTVYSSNYIQDIADTNIVYSESSDMTGAEHAYNILIDCVEIPSTDIEYDGFAEATAIQDTEKVYFNIVYTADDNKSAISVVSELCRICNMELYCENNVIKLKQWQEYAGEISYEIKDRNLLSLQYEHEYDDDKIINSYNIVYKNGAGILWKSDTDAGSIVTYGERKFLVPDQDVDSTTATDFKILLREGDGASYCGDLAITRWSEMKKYVKLSLGWELNFLKLGDQIDLSVYGMTREPVKIIEIKIDPDKGSVDIKGEFLNTPTSYYVRDEEAPDAPLLQEVLPMYDGGLCIKWSLSTETDFVGNKIYFTATPGEWWSEYCNMGISPIDEKGSSMTDDGFRYKMLYQFNNGTEYYFKVTAYDTSFNESGYSNILSAIPYEASTQYQNMYCCTGDPFVAGVSLDVSNTQGGTVPSGYLTYDDGTYDDDVYEYNSFYETHILKSEEDTGFTSVTVNCISVSGYIYFQWREYFPATDTFGAWSAATDTTGVYTHTISGDSVQLRFLICSGLWSDNDQVLIKELI
jgi:hypothetical protein